MLEILYLDFLRDYQLWLEYKKLKQKVAKKTKKKEELSLKKEKYAKNAEKETLIFS